MSFWTFVGIIIIIGAIGDALKKAFQGSQFKKANEDINEKVVELTRRINELESRTDYKEIEKRLQALEAIVVDDEYILNTKFKRVMGD
jgi:hypothetical protein